MVSPTISTENLTRRFGDLVAVEDVNLKSGARPVFWFSGTEWRGKIHHHQDAYWPARAHRGANRDSRPRSGQQHGRGETADRSRAGRHGVVWKIDWVGVFKFRRPHVWSGPRDCGQANRRAARLHAAHRPAQGPGHGLLARHAEEAGTGRGRNPRAREFCFWTSPSKAWTPSPPAL